MLCMLHTIHHPLNCRVSCAWSSVTENERVPGVPSRPLRAIDKEVGFCVSFALAARLRK
jgi:hypothetical protein